MQKAKIIEEACKAIGAGEVSQAAELVRARYPHVPPVVEQRQITPVVATKVFVRDGFVDRYSGDLLVFPPVLRAVSWAIPEAFPYHPNWKMSEGHIGYWELTATVDHIVPIARGGSNDESNLATTSQLRNSAKANWTLEELGWDLHPLGSGSWDGLTSWLVGYTKANPALREEPMVERWLRALARVQG